MITLQWKCSYRWFPVHKSSLWIMLIALLDSLTENFISLLQIPLHFKYLHTTAQKNSRHPERVMLAPLTFLEVLLQLLIYSLFPIFFLNSDVDICILKCLNIKPHFPSIIRENRHTQTEVFKDKRNTNLRTHPSCSLSEARSSGMRQKVINSGSRAENTTIILSTQIWKDNGLFQRAFWNVYFLCFLFLKILPIILTIRG